MVQPSHGRPGALDDRRADRARDPGGECGADAGRDQAGRRSLIPASGAGGHLHADLGDRRAERPHAERNDIHSPAAQARRREVSFPTTPAPTSRRRSATPCRRAASAWSTRTSPISTIACRSEPKSSRPRASAMTNAAPQDAAKAVGLSRPAAAPAPSRRAGSRRASGASAPVRGTAATRISPAAARSAGASK